MLIFLYTEIFNFVFALSRPRWRGAKVKPVKTSQVIRCSIINESKLNPLKRRVK